MLDMKHKNIGATVSILKMINNRNKGDPSKDESLISKLTGGIDELFDEEARTCNSYIYGHCAFPDTISKDSPVVDLNDKPPCSVTTCPLGPLVDDELKGVMDNINLVGHAKTWWGNFKQWAAE